MKILFNKQIISLETSHNCHRLYGILEGRKQRLDHHSLEKDLKKLVKGYPQGDNVVRYIA